MGKWGHDKFSPKTKERNLSFYSHLAEFSLQLEYNLFDLYEYKVTPYFFTGISVFNYSPYTKSGDGIVYLASLDIEGQGFVEDRKKYKTTQFSIPFGGGITWAITDINVYLYLVAYAKHLLYLFHRSYFFVTSPLFPLQRERKR